MWLVAWETEWGFSGGGQASWLGLPEQPCRVPACVSGEQRGPWYRPRLAAGHPRSPSLHLPLATPAQPPLSGRGQPGDARAGPTHAREARERSKSLARRAAGWDSCYLPARLSPLAVAQHHGSPSRHLQQGCARCVRPGHRLGSCVGLTRAMKKTSSSSELLPCLIPVVLLQA